MSSTFPVLGFGPPKVADDLHVWLIAREPPSDEAAVAAVAALPPELADWIRPTDHSDGGSIQWTGSVLCLYSGYGVRFYAQSLEPGHLAWLPDAGELSDADVERVLDEVMDHSRKGPRAPKDRAWQLFGAQLDAWFRAVDELTPLWMVVVGRKVKAPGNARHRASVDWVSAHMDAVLAKTGALREAHGSSHSALGWSEFLVAAALARTGAKALSESERWALLRAIDGAGLAPSAQGTALLRAWPKKQQPEVLAQLLREGHDLGLLLLTDRSTYTLLLDDRVAAAAAAAPRGFFSPYLIDQAMARYSQPKKGVDGGAWLARLVALLTPFVRQHIEAPAEAKPDDRGLQASLADWRVLQARSEASSP